MEVLAAGATSEFPLLVVGCQVKGQVGGGDECFGAQAAAVRVQAEVAVWAPPVREAAACLAGCTLGRRGGSGGCVRVQLWKATSTVRALPSLLVFSTGFIIQHGAIYITTERGAGFSFCDTS